MVVNKNLTIKANSSNTVVNGTFVVTAAGSGSTIQGFTVNYVSEEEGFYLFRPSEVTIKNNTINGFINGITLAYSDDNTVTGNTITNSVNGIYLLDQIVIQYPETTFQIILMLVFTLTDPHDNNIANNIANNNGYGIMCTFILTETTWNVTQ